MANFSSIKFNNVDYPLKDAAARDSIAQLQETVGGAVDDIASLQTSVSGLGTRVTELEQEVDGVSDIIEKGSGDNSTIVGSTSKNTDSGYENIASGSYSYAEGGRRPNETETHEPKTYPQLQATGDFSHAEGASTKASGKYSHAQNKQCTASGEASTAIGASTSASGKNSFSAGELSVASGRTSIAMGGLSEATGDYAVSIGSGVDEQKNVASGPNSFALGFNNTASGEKSYAQGNSSKATGQFAFALGNTNTASGQSATAIGAGSTAGSVNSVAIGHNAEANKDSGKTGGVAIGENVKVTSPYGVSIGAGLIPRQDANGNNVADSSIGRTIIGRYNQAPAQHDIITFGIGSVNNRKTALTIKASGDIVGCGTAPAEDNSLVPKKYVDTLVDSVSDEKYTPYLQSVYSPDAGGSAPCLWLCDVNDEDTNNEIAKSLYYGIKPIITSATEIDYTPPGGDATVFIVAQGEVKLEKVSDYYLIYFRKPISSPDDTSAPYYSGTDQWLGSFILEPRLRLVDGVPKITFELAV